VVEVNDRSPQVLPNRVLQRLALTPTCQVPTEKSLFNASYSPYVQSNRGRRQGCLGCDRFHTVTHLPFPQDETDFSVGRKIRNQTGVLWGVSPISRRKPRFLISCPERIPPSRLLWTSGFIDSWVYKQDFPAAVGRLALVRHVVASRQCRGAESLGLPRRPSYVQTRFQLDLTLRNRIDDLPSSHGRAYIGDCSLASRLMFDFRMHRIAQQPVSDLDRKQIENVIDHKHNIRTFKTLWDSSL
jgi:hypothetical protein